MPTLTQGDAFIQAARARLLTVSSLPAVRLWQNQRGAVSVISAHVEDVMLRWDAEPRELGPSAWSRAEVSYGVTLRVPHGTDAQTSANYVQDIIDAFRASDLSVESRPAYYVGARADPPTQEPQWLAWTITLNFLHDYP